MKYLTVGVFAHVDAGKTTICEALLYHNKVISKMGRVDKGDSFLDFSELERKRGITIYSKLAFLRDETNEATINLMDTPGHKDFVGEALRVFPVLDMALLIVDATSDIPQHTALLHTLLREEGIPAVVFINKMDIAHEDRAQLIKKAEHGLNTILCDWELEKEMRMECVSMCSENLLEAYLDRGKIEEEKIDEAFLKGLFSPCLFGSGLKDYGVDRLYELLFEMMPAANKKADKDYTPYKITRDERGGRLLHIRSNIDFRIKDVIDGSKIQEIRLYNGQKYLSVQAVTPGMIVAVRGLEEVCPQNKEYGLPVMDKWVLSDVNEADYVLLFKKIADLSEEQPELGINLDGETGQVIFFPQGQAQMEILKEQLRQRFGVEALFFPYEAPVYEEYLPEEYEEWAEEDEGDYEEDFYQYDENESIGLDEIDAIIKRAGGANKRKTPAHRRSHWNRYSTIQAGESGREKLSGFTKPIKNIINSGQDYLLVDGYNIIFSWDFLEELSRDNIDSAKDLLIDILSEYAAFTGKVVILVFDAYRVSEGKGSVSRQKGIDIVYTKEAETADQYIEKTSHKIAKGHNVTVATSDRLEQMIVWGEGAMPISARELLLRIKETKDSISDMIKK